MDRRKNACLLSTTDKGFSKWTGTGRERHSCVIGSGTEVLVISPPASPDPSQQETLYFNADFLDFQQNPLLAPHTAHDGVRQLLQFY